MTHELGLYLKVIVITTELGMRRVVGEVKVSV